MLKVLKSIEILRKSKVSVVVNHGGSHIKSPDTHGNPMKIKGVRACQT